MESGYRDLETARLCDRGPGTRPLVATRTARDEPRDNLHHRDDVRNERDGAHDRPDTAHPSSSRAMPSDL